MGVGVVTGSPHICVHARARTHMHGRTYDIIGNPWDFPKSDGCRAITQCMVLVYHVGVYSKTIQMAHTRRLVVIS